MDLYRSHVIYRSENLSHAAGVAAGLSSMIHHHAGLHWQNISPTSDADQLVEVGVLCTAITFVPLAHGLAVKGYASALVR